MKNILTEIVLNGGDNLREDYPIGEATREAYGKALVELGKINSNIVVLDADLSKSTKTALFGKHFPERFFNVGIAEANMVSIASGLASTGKIPFISSFAVFLTCKGFDQLRMCVTYPSNNVKIVVSHGGISVGEDGPSQQSIEDLALMCALPGMTVVVPADGASTRALVFEAAEYVGPVYIRTGRPKAPIIYDKKRQFQLGKGIAHGEGKDLTIVANGLLLAEALKAKHVLEERKIYATVIDMHTVKPLDQELLLEEAKKSKAVVVAEEHLATGGLGTQVAHFLAEHCPVPIEFVAIRDTYAESGTPDELLEKYGLTFSHIITACEQVLARKFN